MTTRRDFLVSSAATIGSLSLLQDCSNGSTDACFENFQRETWRQREVVHGTDEQVRRELVRYATLAPSSHNTQCWKFRIEKKDITILPDIRRRCPAVDPDDHHLFVSLGCSAENLSHAAAAHGFRTNTTYDERGEGKITMALEPAPPAPTPLFHALTERQSSRCEYDGKLVSRDELALLAAAGSGHGVDVLLFTKKPRVEAILDYVVEANTKQMADSAFIAELKSWVRFNKDAAAQSGDGLFSLAAGNPALPSWLGDLLFDVVFREKSENEKYAHQIRSSAGIAVFVSDLNDRAHWVEIGRCYERFALRAASLGIRNALLNQPVEVAALQQQFATFLGISNRRADLVVRFGRGPTMPRSVRRPLDAVIV